MAEEKKGGSEIYYKILGVLVIGIGIGYLWNKHNQKKLMENSPSQQKLKAELEKITNTVASKLNDSGSPDIDILTNKVSTGEFSKDGFAGGSEDVAVPTVVKVEKPAEKVEPASTMNDAGVKLPANAFKAVGANIEAFTDGDVIYSLGDSESKLARVVSGNFTFDDKSKIA